MEGGGVVVVVEIIGSRFQVVSKRDSTFHKE